MQGVGCKGKTAKTFFYFSLIRKMDLYSFLNVNCSNQFIKMPSIVPMFPEIYKSKKVKNVCVEIWLHPIHPFFSWEFLVGSWEEKKWMSWLDLLCLSDFNMMCF